MTAVITGIAKYTTLCEVRFPIHKGTTLCEVCFPIHKGTTYRQKVEEWKKAKFDEYVSATEIDFDQLREDLYADFVIMVKTAVEEEGVFEKEDEEYREEMRKFWASIDLKDI